VTVVVLSGGVGGARLARGIDQITNLDLTIVVNIGDDDDIHGLWVSADLDTVVYTLAGIEGPHGWGRDADSFVTNGEIGRLGADNTFNLGDLDLAMNILRTEALRKGRTLSQFTRQITETLGIRSTVMPASDQRVATMVETDTSGTLPFQEYFVLRKHQDRVTALEYRGAQEAVPTPGAIEAISDADVVLIGPSNPPLSIWPILAIPGYREALVEHDRVIAISPLFRGKALKGPADRVMESLGLPVGSHGVVAAYQDIIDVLVVDVGDRMDGPEIDGVPVVSLDTRIPDGSSAQRLVEKVLAI
jgi:LPPG:FO 2-phospho-L-lactate transferase